MPSTVHGAVRSGARRFGITHGLYKYRVQSILLNACHSLLLLTAYRLPDGMENDLHATACYLLRATHYYCLLLRTAYRWPHGMENNLWSKDDRTHHEVERTASKSEYRAKYEVVKVQRTVHGLDHTTSSESVM